MGRPPRTGQRAWPLYSSLGIPPAAVWHDDLDRPHNIYHGEPIPGLTG